MLLYIRDPVECIGSWASLVKTVKSQMLENVNDLDIGTTELKVMSSMMKSALQYRDSHPELEDRFFDAKFSELTTNPIPVVKRIYERFGLNFSHEAEVNMQKYIKEQKTNRDKINKHEYTLEAVQLTENDVLNEFKDYYESKYFKQ